MPVDHVCRLGFVVNWANLAYNFLLLYQLCLRFFSNRFIQKIPVLKVVKIMYGFLYHIAFLIFLQHRHLLKLTAIASGGSGGP